MYNFFWFLVETLGKNNAVHITDTPYSKQSVMRCGKARQWFKLPPTVKVMMMMIYCKEYKKCSAVILFFSLKMEMDRVILSC